MACSSIRSRWDRRRWSAEATGHTANSTWSAWVETIASVDQGFQIALTGGLFRIEHEEHFVTHDAFETAEELFETASDWRDTEIPAGLAERVRAGSPPFTVRQDVRLRLLVRG